MPVPNSDDRRKRPPTQNMISPIRSLNPDNENAKYRLSNDPQLRTKDVAHFNAAGYDMVVAHILPQVEELIARTRR